MTMRYALILAAAAVLLGACSVPVVLQNPRTGESMTCSDGSWGDQSPWSQREACVADHVAQGWVVKHED
jgi:hypothetical protein